MINQQLLKPESIVVVGGSNNVHKPGGAIVRNLLQGNYQGTLRIINPKEDEVQGIKVYHNPEELPPTDMAILVVAAKFCPGYVEYLAKEKNVRAFIIILLASVRRPRREPSWSSRCSTPARSMVPRSSAPTASA